MRISDWSSDVCSSDLGIGLQDHYAAAWQHVAERMKSNSRIVYELFNEPSPGYVDIAPCALPTGCPEFDVLKLVPLYEKVLSAVRQVDATRLIFVEPNAFFGLDSRTWLTSMQDPQVGFAFHAYCALALVPVPEPALPRSEEQTSELQSLMRISYAVICLKTKNNNSMHHF